MTIKTKFFAWRDHKIAVDYHFEGDECKHVFIHELSSRTIKVPELPLFAQLLLDIHAAIPTEQADELS